MLYIVDIHGDIEGDYEIIKKYEEKTGHWIHHPEIEFICAEHWECSVCHKSTMTNPVCKDNDYDNMYFCPKCGAKMVEPYNSESEV